jgi:hypothetical protein
VRWSWSWLSSQRDVIAAETGLSAEEESSIQELLEIKYEMNYVSFVQFLSGARERRLELLERRESDDAIEVGGEHWRLLQQLSVLRLGVLMRETLATEACVEVFGAEQVVALTAALEEEAASLPPEIQLLRALGVAATPAEAAGDNSGALAGQKRSAGELHVFD